MDHSWRSRPPPPIQGNLCPSCSISHFPFCPPPHPIPFNQNPRFHSHDGDSFQRPFFDPFLEPPGARANLRPPFAGNPGDRFRDVWPWHRNPSLEYRHFHEQSQIGDYGMVNEGHGEDFGPSRYDHGGVGFKRMRVDEMGSSNISMDNERRLKLIREHGGVANGTPEGGLNSESALGQNVNREREGYLQEKTVFKRTFGSNDVGHLTLKPQISYGTSELWDQRSCDFDRTETSSRSEPDFNIRNYEEDHGLAFGQHNMRSYRSEELEQLLYGQGKNILQPSLLPNGSNVPLAGSSTNFEKGQHDQDLTTHYHEGGVQHNTDLGDRYTRSAPYPTSRVPSENYYHHSSQGLPPSYSLPAKEADYSHPTGWHGLSTASAMQHEQRGSFTPESRDPNHHLAQPHAREDFMQLNHVPFPGGNSPMQASRVLNVQPPLPASPPPPLPADPPGHRLSESHAFSSPIDASSSLFPIPVNSEVKVPSPYTPIPEARPLAQPYFHDKAYLHGSTGFATEEFQTIKRRMPAKFLGEAQPFPPVSSDKPKVVDASHIFKLPNRATRPDHFVIILRGLPGSGKSYLAKMLRDLEVENGGNAPRIHSMDDYFMTEVEKIEEGEGPKSSGSVRGKKQVMKKVMEYCYEPEMEEAYRSSMLKAFKKTLDEGVFSFVIVDDRNLRVADFDQFWATAKRSGYEVYLLEATYKDPAGCAARNLHGFTQDDIQKMAGQWEEASSLYLKLDVKSLFQGDDLKESGIQEVDMDTGDGDFAGSPPGSEEKCSGLAIPPIQDYSPNGISKFDKKWDAKGDPSREIVKELGRSKWSDDLDDDNAEGTEATKGNTTALSGLIKAYAKGGKSVHWGDQVGNMGFAIGASRKVNKSLVIGPGSGYNLKSNPLLEELVSTRNIVESKRQSSFQERIRAERESFRAVFDKRRHRIGGLGLQEE